MLHEVEFREVQATRACKSEIILSSSNNFVDAASQLVFRNLYHLVVFDLHCRQLASLLATDNRKRIRRANRKYVSADMQLSKNCKIII